MTIKNLFDPAKNIYRTIEKVITYNVSQEARLRAEITEYIVTDNIEEQFEKLLTKMQTAMDLGGGNEVGVWVSGFYGSGKSSFTKYLGLALDDRVQVDGIRFLKHLQDRLNRPQTRALLNTLASRHSAAVVLLDLASEMLTGATMEEVSTVLYYKVLQWAGYSSNLKVAALERRLKRDGRYQEFLDHVVQAANGASWSSVKDDPLFIDSVIPEIAHALYPTLFKSASAFTTETSEFIRFENDRVKEMIDIAREHTGKQYIIFIIDEVGQYVGARPNLILNLDGLAKNLKEIGDGKVWIIGTAQQTLTEDDQKAALNSPELYKLKDRFPIQIDLESSDIKEICYRRLLGKSPTGERQLGALFDQHGQALRHNTKLQDARYYDADFDRTTFINLYPFLPAHFDILLRLLGALAKSTGGIGLRSAIKVIQDILVEGPAGRDPVADHPIGWLATTVTLYDSLEKDIRRAEPSIHKAVEKAKERFFDSPIHQEVAKTVAVLQILKNMPVTPQNVTSLMHPAIDAPSRRDLIDAAIKDLIGDAFVPFGEKEGNLCFFSEKLNEIDQERLQLAIRGIETRRIQSDVLREAFNPLPAARLEGTLSVTTGLKAQYGAQVSSVAGERETVQTIVELVDPTDYDTARTRLLDESRQRAAQHTVFLLGRTSPEIEAHANEIYRCEQIVQRYRNEPDQEVKEYCSSQAERANRLRVELERLLRRLLSQGSFIFRGRPTAVDAIDHDLLEAAKKHLAEVAEQVFDRYKEAPIRAETALAEKFLRAAGSNLRSVTSTIDPLGLVQVSGGKPSIKTDVKALISIRDYVDRNGTVDGKRISDIFTEAPFAWSPDTLRYLVAALLIAGEIKLKVSGREVTVNGQQAIDALRTNQSFKTVGVALRDERPTNEVLGRAAERLTEITGESVIPLEDDISKAATRAFPQLQLRYGSLADRLEGLELPGADGVRALNQELADVLLTDASDAPQRLGGAESALYERLRWAREVDVALKNGLEATVRGLQQHRQEIASLPSSGVPGQLRADLADELALINQRLAHESFPNHAADLRSALTAIKARVGEAINQQAQTQRETIREAQQELQQLPGWLELKQEEQASQLAELDGLAISPASDLGGLRQLLNQEFEIQSRVRDLKRRIEQLATERRLAREQEERRRLERDQEHEPQPMHDGSSRFERKVKVPAKVASAASLDELIRQLQELRSALMYYRDIDVTIEIED
jgi:hypothetical protein